MDAIISNHCWYLSSANCHSQGGNFRGRKWHLLPYLGHGSWPSWIIQPCVLLLVHTRHSTQSIKTLTLEEKNKTGRSWLKQKHISLSDIIGLLYIPNWADNCKTSICLFPTCIRPRGKMTPHFCLCLITFQLFDQCSTLEGWGWAMYLDLKA